MKEYELSHVPERESLRAMQSKRDAAFAAPLDCYRAWGCEQELLLAMKGCYSAKARLLQGRLISQRQLATQ